MSGNRFGTLFQYTTFGESHGIAIGCVVDGVPPRIPLSEADLQPFMDRRRPGQSKFTTQRNEPDTVKILSGVFEGMTTGAPIGLLIENQDARSKDYGEIKDQFRPGHADYTFQAKYGIRDHRGGGRSSARETAMRVAAGAIAQHVLWHQIGRDVQIMGGVVQLGALKINRDRMNWDTVNDNPFFCPDPDSVPVWEDYLKDIRKSGSSCGAIVEIVARGVPVGLGAPVYDRLDADIAKAMMSINAVKGVEIGNGFESAALSGEDNADQMRLDAQGNPVFLSNNAGGILGGISNGNEIVVRMAFKPTSSILTPRQSIDVHGNEVDVRTIGRHDPCVGIRGVPVAEAMLACVLADHWLRHKAQCL
jgi:chorismate synthase